MKLLLQKYLDNTCNADEKAKVEHALQCNPISDTLQNALECLWNDPSLSDLYGAGAKHEKISDRIKSTFKRPEITSRYPQNKWWKHIAAAMILVLVGFASWHMGNIGLLQKEELYTIVSPEGQTLQVALADGSMAWLNTGSSLTYTSRFGKVKRSIVLKGEGFFEVAKDKKHPFIVTCNEVEITALGTRFNVKNTKKNEDVIVTLEEGRVKTSYAAQDCILEPGMQAIVSDKKLTKKTVNTRLYTSWHLGQMLFRDESLLNIATQLEKVYDIEIVFKDEALKAYRYRGTIDSKNSLRKTLEILKLSTDIDYEKNNDQIILKQKK